MTVRPAVGLVRAPHDKRPGPTREASNPGQCLLVAVGRDRRQGVAGRDPAGAAAASLGLPHKNTALQKNQVSVCFFSNNRTNPCVPKESCLPSNALRDSSIHRGG